MQFMILSAKERFFANSTWVTVCDGRMTLKKYDEYSCNFVEFSRKMITEKISLWKCCLLLDVFPE